MMDEIWFYSEKEKQYGVFSNFYPCKIIIGEDVYPNSESYFQAEKFRGENASKESLEYARIIQMQSNANKSAILARQRKPNLSYKWANELYEKIQESIRLGVSIREDWNSIRDNVMRRVVYQKFHQNKDLAEISQSCFDILCFMQ